MKKVLFVFAAMMAVLVSCGDKKKTTDASAPGSTPDTGLTVNESEGATGQFSADGTSFNGNSSTQYFGDKTTGAFSVLCQQDDPMALLQAVFHNEDNAKGTLKPGSSAYKVEAGDAHIALSGTAIGDKEFVTTSKSTGTISVDGKTMTLKDLKLFNSDNQEKTVNATVNY